MALANNISNYKYDSKINNFTMYMLVSNVVDREKI